MLALFADALLEIGNQLAHVAVLDVSGRMRRMVQQRRCGGGCGNGSGGGCGGGVGSGAVLMLLLELVLMLDVVMMLVVVAVYRSVRTRSGHQLLICEGG